MSKISISYNQKLQTFHICTAHTSYVMGVHGGKYLAHLYYGAKIADGDDLRRFAFEERAGWPFITGEKVSMTDGLAYEYPTEGVGDYRETAISIRSADGQKACDLVYDSYEIIEGKPEIDGLPSTRLWDEGSRDAVGRALAESGSPAHEAPEDAGEALTLVICLKDEVLRTEVKLYYSIFGDSDALIRRTQINHKGDGAIYLDRVMSASLDLPEAGAACGYQSSASVGYGRIASGMDVLTLNGSWARERHIDRRHIGHGVVSVGSKRGIPGHQNHPFIAVMDQAATDTTGDVYAMNFVYSGDHYESVEMDQNDRYRVMMGIHPEYFSWKLEGGESFSSPEVVMVYSGEGIGGMTHIYHDLYREHLIPIAWAHAIRPVLINNWEATYFDFDEEKIYDIASLAAKQGIELFVMDDGWFGEREEPDGSLGDWFVNENKIHGGLKKLVDRVHDLGMKFGIWFEPEMISEKSKLYLEHPDWALQVKDREISQARNQFVLDLSRSEIVDHIYEMISRVIRDNGVDYVKWDMNRPLADIGSVGLPADRQGEIKHRYMLGVYEMQRRLTSDFPELLLENCAGGGSRFDPGMLYFSPQIWCSDDTDAIERLMIQEGTAIVYPLSTFGSHVSDCPNHIVGRVTPFETRGVVACQGGFGYELDITKIARDEVDMIPGQISDYKKYAALIQSGDYYRLASYASNHRMDVYQLVSKNRDVSVVSYTQVLGVPNARADVIRLQGLDPERSYRIDLSVPGGKIGENKDIDYKCDGMVYRGNTLMNAGLILPALHGDYRSVWIDVTVV